MAYQRPFLISLKKSDPQQPWGFRTFGGKEYGEPHIVEKVVPDSIAEHCGLREGDEIIQIGRINVQDTTFGQVQEILARCGNKIEMFVIREDLLTPRKGKEPAHVKAVVHNPYNSPLNLYSTENIAETLAKQAEVLTEGQISSAEEEDAPENLSFKQKSAVFQLLEEQAKQESANQYLGRPAQPRKPAAPPPPKPATAAQYQQNKENYQPQGYQQGPTYQQSQQYQPAYSSQVNEYHQKQPGSVEYRREEKRVTEYSVDSQNASPAVNHYPADPYQSSEYRSTYKVSPTPPVRTTQQSSMATVYSQQQSYHTQQYQTSQETAYQSQRDKPQQQWQQQNLQRQQQQQQQQWQQQQQQQQQQQWQQQQLQNQQWQQQQQRQQIQQQSKPHADQQQYHRAQEAKREAIFNAETQSSGAPITYKAPPAQKTKVNWPPQSSAQQNGRWSSESPTPPSPSKVHVEGIWPPKQPTVKELPKTGFNPGILREQGTGRRCVWPPPKPEDEFRSGRTTPQSPVTGRRITWNPSPSPPPVRRSPFGSMSPVTRRKDISWPPPQPTVHKTESVPPRPSPTFARKARFDDYIKQHASSNVPSTYRPPPGAHRVTTS